MTHHKSLSLLSILILFAILLAACEERATVVPQPTAIQSTPQVNAVTPTATIKPQPTLTPTSARQRSLVVCLGQEPASLYMYGNSSRGMWSVLEALYDGPIDTRKFSAQPVILSKLPSLADKDAVYTPVEVINGADVVDANGDLVDLVAGTRVLPSGCASPDCAQTWDGKSALKMDQLTLTYKLLPGLKWSDGTPLTAEDSVYSFNVASSPSTPVSKRLVDRTAAYQAKDAQTVTWTGVPGFSVQRFDGQFWIPLPKHMLGKYQPAELLKAEEATTRPLGWGPYKLEEWKKGSFIRLSKNSQYFRAAEGLPRFDTLLFRFLGEQGDNNVQALLSGECDVVDESVLLFDQLQTMLEQQQTKKLRVFVGQGPEWEQLSFGIKPAGYDDGYNPASDRPDFFSNLKMRQAVAYCIDRAALIRTLLNSQSAIPGGYVPSVHPVHMQDLKPLAYDVAQGNKLLSEMGWKDTDNNPATPRVAESVPNVTKGTPLTLNYLTTEAALRKRTAEMITKNLADCGIQVKVQAQSPGVLYAPGPDGALFGRKFDLAQFSWEAGSLPPCNLYESSAIPTSKNNWLGGNITGYASPAFDTACQKARFSKPEPAADYLKVNQEAQKLFAQELPVLPLYFRLKLAASRPDLCGFEMDVTTRSVLWNMEQLSYGGVCP